MEFTIARDELMQALYLTQGIVERRTTIPILANVLVESAADGVTIAATDQEVGVRRTCTAKVKKKGALTTGARKLYEIVRECPEGDLSFKTLENNWIEVAAAKSRFKIVGLDPKEFPAMPAAGTEPDPHALTVSATTLREMIERTLFAVSVDETRLNIGGIFLERPEAGLLRLVATDGHRLSMVTRPVDGSETVPGVIIPRKGVAEISKVIESGDAPVRIGLQGGVVHASYERVEVSIRLVEGEFPDYRQVIPPKSDRHLLASSEALLAALRRVSIVSSERTRGIKMQIDTGRVEISSINPDIGEATEDVEVEYTGAPFSIGFNAKYLIDVLGVVPAGTQVDITFNDEVSPGVVRCEGDPEYLYVVMPMRL